MRELPISHLGKLKTTAPRVCTSVLTSYIFELIMFDYRTERLLSPLSPSEDWEIVTLSERCLHVLPPRQG